MCIRDRSGACRVSRHRDERQRADVPRVRCLRCGGGDSQPAAERRGVRHRGGERCTLCVPDAGAGLHGPRAVLLQTARQRRTDKCQGLSLIHISPSSILVFLENIFGEVDDLPEREEQAERLGDDDAVYSQRILRMSQRGRVEVQIERNQRGDQAHGQRGDLSGVCLLYTSYTRRIQ